MFFLDLTFRIKRAFSILVAVKFSLNRVKLIEFIQQQGIYN